MRQPCRPSKQDRALGEPISTSRGKTSPTPFSEQTVYLLRFHTSLNPQDRLAQGVPLRRVDSDDLEGPDPVVLVAVIALPEREAHHAVCD